MLIVNDTKLAQIDKGDPFKKHYNEAIKLLRKRFGKSVVISYPEDVGLKTRLTSGQVIREYPAGFSFNSTQIYTWVEGDYEIQFATNSKMGPGGKLSYYPKMIDYTGKLTLDLMRQQDLAFFYIFVSPTCAVFEDGVLKKFQNDSRKRVFYEVYDAAGRAEKELVIESKVNEAKAMITAGRFQIPYEMIISISIVYGIVDLGNLNPNESIARKALLDFVTQKNSRNEYDFQLIDQFIEDVNYPELVEIKALVKQLAAAGIIGLDRQNKVLKYFVYKDGKKVTEICNVNKMAQPEESLISFLQNEPETLSDLKEVFEKAAKQ